MISRATLREIVSFGTIGVIGFVSDAVLLSLLRWLWGFDLVTSRLGAFAVTITIAWWLNRRLTFRSDASAPSEWLRYALVNGTGALLNLGIFFWLVHRVRAMAEMPLLALALAAFVTMNYGFIVTKYVAFNKARR